MITDCDDFTKKWFKQNLGIDMQPIKVKRNPPQKIIHPIPPHTGIGSEEDSLLSVYFLKPKATLKDMEKMFKSDTTLDQLLNFVEMHYAKKKRLIRVVFYFLFEKNLWSVLLKIGCIGS